MIGLGIIELIILLVILGGGAVVLGGIALAVAKGRPGLALLVAALAFLAPVVLITLAAMLFAVSRSVVPQVTYSTSSQTGNGSSPSSSTITLDNGTVQMSQSGLINGTPMPTITVPTVPSLTEPATMKLATVAPLFLVFGGIALLILVARRSFGPPAARGLVRIWPALVALPIIGLLIFRGLGVQRTKTWTSEQAAQSVAPLTVPKHQINQSYRNQQQIALSKLAEATREIEKQIDQLDIRELMDKFDAPRIILQAPMNATSAPAVLAIAAAKAEAPPSETPADTVPPDVPEPKAIAQTANRLQQKSTTQTSVTTVADTIETVAETAASPAKPAEVAAPSDAPRADKPLTSRPAWIDGQPKRTGPVRREVIASDEYATADECYRAADVYLLIKTFDHVRELQGLPYTDSQLPNVTFQNGMILADGRPIATGSHNPQWIDSRIRYLNDLGVGLDYIRREVVAKDSNTGESREFLESVDRSVGPMKKLYMQMEFNPAIDNQLMEQISAYMRQSRIGMVGVGAASVLLLLTTVWGLLKVDTATKGYYSKWLFVGVPAMIIVGGLLCWADPLHVF